MTFSKKISNVITISFLLVGSSQVTLAKGANPTAKEIITKVRDQATVKNYQADVNMILIDKKGNKRTRNITSFAKDIDGEYHSLSFFTSPADVKGTSFLSISKKEKSSDNSMWLYLPAIKKVNKISQVDRHQKFMGSDFSYADMEPIRLDNYSFKLLPKNNPDHWIIESMPLTTQEAEASGYSKSVMYIHKTKNLITRAARWIHDSDQVKIFKANDTKQIDGIWTVTKAEMMLKQGSKTLHTTQMSLSNVSYSISKPKNFYSTRMMQRGI